MLNLFGNEVNIKNDLKNMFGVNPFSVIDTRDGKYQRLKKKWKGILNEDGSTREEEDFNIRRQTGIQRRNNEKLTDKQKQFIYNEKNISLFDPVITQLCYEWFGIPNGLVFDCCAGDTMKGNVIAYLGGKYKGVELRNEQVKHNNNKAFEGAEWFCDDGINVSEYISYNNGDLLLSCPPYYNAEVYSDKITDMSNMDSYEEFIQKLSIMYSESIKCLKENRFACIVIGNIRKEKHRMFLDYYPFKRDVIQIFENNGMYFYNDIVILKANGTSQMRAISYMRQKKVVCIHEYLLVFYKGNMNKIKETFNGFEKTKAGGQKNI